MESLKDIDQEIQRIIEYQNSLLPPHNVKDSHELKACIDLVINQYHSSNYDFKKYIRLVSRQIDKIRHIKTYPPFSTEMVLCIYLKRLLDRKLHIQYPNRNEYMISFFDTVNALKNVQNYTIYKFDFEDFFNSVSAEYVFKKYLCHMNFEHYQLALLEEFVTATEYAFTGLNTSNIFCEIIAQNFDDILLQKLVHKGLIFYKRFIDDGILIFNECISEDECDDIVNKTIMEVFNDNQINSHTKCTTHLNCRKKQYVSSASGITSPQTISFLGYQFDLTIKCNDNKRTTSVKYGITDEKIKKYAQQIANIVKAYKLSNDTELLRHKLKAFTSRVVYQTTNSHGTVWKSKGFISNYQELRFRITNLNDQTLNFLKNGILDAFNNQQLSLPYFIHDDEESIYSLLNNMRRFKTLLFVESIGINLKTLKKLCGQIKISTRGKNYDDLIHEYLIKVGVGH